MGNSSSSSGRAHNEETVDFGFLVPQGVYTGQKDWNQALVTQFICARRLAPFYRPLEDYDESWDDDRILAARKELPDAEQQNNGEIVTRVETGNSAHSTKSSSLGRKAAPPKEIVKPDAAIYRGAVECPICFLYYPPNINHSRCCDQAICTECFVQIKRNEPTPTHLVSEPAACPYCVQENFGIVYKPPSWRAGIGSEGFNSESRTDAAHYATHKRRQKTVVHDAPEVVTIDHIRPDWEAKLAAVQATVARRANRRIIMRQVGDRLIPVGVTSGRVHAINGEDGQSGDGGDQSNGGGRRRRRHQQGGQTLDQFLGSMGMAGPDLEELMVMEAMRLSLLEHEAQQKKEEEEKKKKAGETPGADSAASESPSQQVDTPETSASGASQSSSPTQPDTSSSQAAASPSTTSNLREAAERWRVARSTSPPAFSTLRAAMTAASTAGAVLARPSESQEADSRSEEPPARTPANQSPTPTDSQSQQPEQDREPDSPASATSSACHTAEPGTSLLSVGPESPVTAATTPSDLPATSTDITTSDPIPIPTQAPAPLHINNINEAGFSEAAPPPIATPSYDVLPSSPGSTDTTSSDRKPLISTSEVVSPETSEGAQSSATLSSTVHHEP